MKASRCNVHIAHIARDADELAEAKAALSDSIDSVVAKARARGDTEVRCALHLFL